MNRGSGHGTNGRADPDSLASIAAEIAAPGPECVVADADTERRRRIRLIESATFATQRYPRDWLVKNVLVKGQTAIVGGPRKALKTSLLVDLAVSLGSPRPAGRPAGEDGAIVRPVRQNVPRFLGKFEVPTPVRVGFFSGESGEATLQETALRVCKSKGVELGSLGVLWGTELPHLSDDCDLEVLRSLIAEHDLGVVIIDPAYLALLAGSPRIQAGNLFDMGPILSRFSRACLDAGATPILAHHSVKTREAGSRYRPLELEELAFAGIQEFARQWCLIARREAYEQGSGRHSLWLNVGGSAGFSGLWGVDVEEGVVDDAFFGRSWGVNVMTAAEVDNAVADDRERAKQARADAAEGEARKAILAHLASPDCRGGDSLTGIADASGRSKAGRVRPLIERMVEDGVLVAVARLQKGQRTCTGYRLAPDTGPD